MNNAHPGTSSSIILLIVITTSLWGRMQRDDLFTSRDLQIDGMETIFADGFRETACRLDIRRQVF